MATIFWDAKGVLLVDYLLNGVTINAERYCETLRKLRSGGNGLVCCTKKFCSTTMHVLIPCDTWLIYWSPFDERPWPSPIFTQFGSEWFPSVPPTLRTPGRITFQNRYGSETGCWRVAPKTGHAHSKTESKNCFHATASILTRLYIKLKNKYIFLNKRKFSFQF